MSNKAELMKAQIREARLHSHISGMYGALGNTELQQLYGNKSKDLQNKLGEALDQGFGGLQVSLIERGFAITNPDESTRLLCGEATGETEADEQDVEADEQDVETAVAGESERVTVEDIRNSSPGSTFRDDFGNDWEWTGEGVALHYRDEIGGAINLWDCAWTRSTTEPRGNYATAEVIDEPELPTHEGALIDVTEVKGEALDKPIRARHSGAGLFPWYGVEEKLPVPFGVASNEEIIGFRLVDEGAEVNDQTVTSNEIATAHITVELAPEVKLKDLKRGDKIRVFEENRYGPTRTSEAGVEYEHDGMREGDAPWCRTPRAGKTETCAYLNSDDIVRWELVSRKADESVEDEPTGPDVKLGDLGEGAVIRVFEENRHDATQTFEEGITYTHDGERDLYWTRDDGQGDELPVYLENEDIIRWELVSR